MNEGLRTKMHVVRPEYYDRFQCLAGKCPATCCIDWLVEIDDEALARYAGMKGETGYLVKNAIDWMDSRFALKNGRCALYTEEGLCLLQKELGEEALCRTCREYPRHTEEYPGIREYSLSLSCPEAAALICGKERADAPSCGYRSSDTDQEENLDFGAFDRRLFDQACCLRKEMFNVLRRTEKDGQAPGIAEKMAGILELACSAQAQTDTEPLFDTCGDSLLQKLLGDDLQGQMDLFIRMETIDPAWRKILEKTERQMKKGAVGDLPYPRSAMEKSFVLDDGKKVSLRQIEENLLEYYLYVYLPGAAYDGDILSKACLAVFLAEWACRILVPAGEGNPPEESALPAFAEAMVQIARFARQMEHSDDNLNLLEEWIRGKIYRSSNP